MVAQYFLLSEDIGYNIAQNGDMTVLCQGIIARRHGDEYRADLLDIGADALSGNLDFSELFGSYRIVIFDKNKDRAVFWCDNCSSMLFFYDTVTGSISDSLLCLLRQKDSPQPDLDAIACIFSRARELSCRTPIADIRSTSPDCVYTLDGGHLLMANKNLPPIDTDGYGVDIHELISGLVSVIGNKKYAAICTGGTDSRVIIANLISLGQQPKLIITGSKDNVDVKLAKRISQKLSLPLSVIDSSSDKPNNWLTRGFEFSDGCYDVISSYRHLCKAEFTRKFGIVCEFGGCGGEFYKNDFYLSGIGIPSVEKITERVTSATSYTVYPKWAGDALKKPLERVNTDIKRTLSKCAKSDRLTSFNDAGRLILRSSYSSIAHPVSRFCAKIDPLLEPRVIASMHGSDPRKLYVHTWHREQIAKYAPQLADIETNLGYTFTTSPSDILKDRLRDKKRKAVISAKLVVKKYSKALAQRSGTMKVWQGDFEDALDSDEVREALDICKQIKLIDPEINASDIPPTLLGQVLRVGLLFSPKYGLKKNNINNKISKM